MPKDISKSVLDLLDDRIEKFHPEDGDVFVVYTDRLPQEDIRESAKIFTDRIGKLGKKILVLIVPTSMSIQSLDTDEMKQHGWVRGAGKTSEHQMTVQ